MEVLVAIFSDTEAWTMPAAYVEELRRRLEQRGSDDVDSRQRRFERAREEIEHYPLFDYMIVNDELQRALAQLRGIVLAESCRQWRVAPKAESLLER